MTELAPPVLVRWSDLSGRSHEQIFFGAEEARVASKALIWQYGKTVVTMDLLINPIEHRSAVIE